MILSIPFLGNKRYSYKQVKKIVKEGNYDRVFEPFGGSCVLSVNLFKDGLVDKAVANDYDHFFDDYETYLDYKDHIVKSCLEYGIIPRTKSGHFPGMPVYYYDEKGNRCPIDMNLKDEEREYLQSLIKQIPEKYWGYLVLGANFVYSSIILGSEIKLSDFKYFKEHLDTDIQREYMGYLNKIELDNLDYKDFLKKHKDEIDDESILILDPPYAETMQNQYKESFDDAKTVDLINNILELGCDFIFFNHDRNKVEQWLDGLDYELMETGKPITTSTGKRKDVMAYVRR